MLARDLQNPEQARPRPLPTPQGRDRRRGEPGDGGQRRVKAPRLERGNKRRRPVCPAAPRSGAPTVSAGVGRGQVGTPPPHQPRGGPQRPYL